MPGKFILCLVTLDVRVFFEFDYQTISDFYERVIIVLTTAKPFVLIYKRQKRLPLFSPSHSPVRSFWNYGWINFNLNPWHEN